MKMFDSMRARRNIALLRVIGVALGGLAAGTFLIYRGRQPDVENAGVWTTFGVVALVGAAIMAVALVQVVRDMQRLDRRSDDS